MRIYRPQSFAYNQFVQLDRVVQAASNARLFRSGLQFGVVVDVSVQEPRAAYAEVNAGLAARAIILLANYFWTTKYFNHLEIKSFTYKKY